MLRPSKFILIAAAVCVSLAAAARPEGIFNPAATFVGDLQGIDSNVVSSGGSTLACTYTPVTTGTQNVAYTGATPSASGGVPAYTFSETGALPTGLSINTSTGVISGTPTVNGSFPSIQVKVTDTASTVVNCGASFTLVINYQGPGDVVAFTWWGGFRAYSAATAGTKAVRIVRASDSTQTDINTLANGSFDAASATTFCAATTCKVVTVYDKVSTNDVTQATDANRPALTANALNTSYCMTTTGATPTFLASSATFSASQPYSMVHVSKQTSTVGDQGLMALMNAAFTDGATANFSAGGVTYTLFAGGNGNITITSSTVFRAYQAVFNAAASIGAVDGVETTVNPAAQAITAETINLGRNLGSQNFTGLICEAGYLSATISGANRTTLNTNMHAAYGGF